MRLLLDTHVWLWLQTEPERVGDDVLARLASPDNELLLSAASTWEIAIKYGIGKLALPEPPSTYVPERMRSTGTTALPVDVGHTLAVAALPPLHRDPFDRLLVAQARELSLRLITADELVAQYDADIELVG